MKRHWLRGVLLGVSLALLLAGGVALAIEVNLTLETDKTCFECCPTPQVTGNPVPLFPPEDEECVVNVTIDGYSPDPVLWEFTPAYAAGPPPSLLLLQGPPGPPPTTGQLYAFCDPEQMYWLWGYELAAAGSPAAALNGPVPRQVPIIEYGEYTVGACQGVDALIGGEESCDEVRVLYLRECPEPEVEEEFVPEPGTIMLLGSGLVGLAGYATLRWRAKK